MSAWWSVVDTLVFHLSILMLFRLVGLLALVQNTCLHSFQVKFLFRKCERCIRFSLAFTSLKCVTRTKGKSSLSQATTNTSRTVATPQTTLFLSPSRHWHWVLEQEAVNRGPSMLQGCLCVQAWARQLLREISKNKSAVFTSWFLFRQVMDGVEVSQGSVSAAASATVHNLAPRPHFLYVWAL